MRMEATIRQAFTWSGLQPQVERWCKMCKNCQLFKKQRKKYGHLPAKEAETVPWECVNVNLIGPYTIKTPKKKYTLTAMTMIDPATSWFEIGAVVNENSETTSRILDSMWLARYPQPKEIGYNAGSEFKWLSRNWLATWKPITKYNPQGNSVLACIHQVLGNQLHTFESSKQELDKQEPFKPFLTAVAYAICSTYHTTLQAMPGQLVFGQDMILPLKFQANWALIAAWKKETIIKSNEWENKKCHFHTFKVGDKVLLEQPIKKGKISAPCKGLYKITRVHTNGTVHVRKNAATEEWLNIRLLLPFYKWARPSGSAWHTFNKIGQSWHISQLTKVRGRLPGLEKTFWSRMTFCQMLYK